VPGDFHYVDRMWGRFNIALESQMYSGRREDIAELVRMVRRVRDSTRRARGLHRRRDPGVMGFTAYDTALAMRQLVDWVLREDCSVSAPTV
jgi:hypothetical protein